MKKVLELLKKYLVITFSLSIIIVIYSIYPMARTNTLPIINLYYIVKVVLGILIITIILIPAIALADLCIVRSVTYLFKDFKYADKSGRICLIIGLLLVLFQKIGEWTR